MHVLTGTRGCKVEHREKDHRTTENEVTVFMQPGTHSSTGQRSVSAPGSFHWRRDFWRKTSDSCATKRAHKQHRITHLPQKPSNPKRRSDSPRNIIGLPREETHKARFVRVEFSRRRRTKLRTVRPFSQNARAGGGDRQKPAPVPSARSSYRNNKRWDDDERRGRSQRRASRTLVRGCLKVRLHARLYSWAPW